ncbi:MAG TPA: beta-galactosidase trimerization domain-containing protein [Terriglobia bacterium]|nr:beta-galactosidase trimerization domain-containing protein [Terriglobia bacterium]
MNHRYRASRRTFLRAALATPIIGMAPGSLKPAAPASPAGTNGSVVSRIELDKDLYESEAVLNGSISFRQPAAGPVIVRWIDSFDRVVRQAQFPSSTSGVARQSFSFELSRGFTYRNWIRVSVDGAEQTESVQFLLSPPPKPWDDFHVISWAHYPDGFYDLLRQSGIDGTIAYRDGNWDNVLDNNFNFYVEQMAWEVFSIYHKNQPLWRDLLNQIELDRNNLDLWIRQPCINDPKTDEYVADHLRRYVREHRAFRPLFYNIADELGQGDQIRPNDFCHSKHCTARFAEYLRALYGTVGALGQEWQAGEQTKWDDESLNNGSDWTASDLMIRYTTTDRAFDAVAVAALQAKYGGIAGLNKEWGTGFPAPQGGSPDREQWRPLLALVAETRSVSELTDKALSDKLGPIERENERWGTATGWGSPNKPVGFKSWSEVAAFLNRFYHELSQVRATEGWNVAPWCDFRNFMDATFADAIGRTRDVCRAEDPHARCSTEGGQAPFAFGWYNYENVVKVVDVIEPYNIGNNVEVIRSLNPHLTMVSTHGYEHKPGTPLTDLDRRFQKRAPQPIWWGLFHGHRGSLIWDDNLPEYRFVDEETRQLTPSAQTFSDLFNELHRGIGKLILNSRRLHDGIAIHFSQPSMQVHWLLDNVQNARRWMAHSGQDRYSHFTAVRNSWTKLIEDLGLQYEFVGRRGIEDGKLARAEYRALIMPQSVAVSAREADQIRQFVGTGGLVIADCRAASMNEHGRDLGSGQLDDVFGIARFKGQSKGQPKVQSAVVAEGAESLGIAGKKLNLKPGDETISATAGKPLIHSGQVPLIIVNDYGEGKAVFLNAEVSSYAYDRLQANSDTSLPDVVEAVLKLVHIEPQVRVLDASGRRLPGTEVVRFANGPCKHVAIFRNPQLDDGGWGDYPTGPERGWAGEIDNALLEKEAQVTIVWPTALPTYDVRGKRDLGDSAKVEMALDPWSPLIVTRSPQPIPELHIEGPEQVRAGDLLALTLRDEAPMPEGTFRAVHLEFTTPDGRPYDLYARNLLVKATPQVEHLPLAFSDPKGSWKVNAYDVMTGRAATVAFTVEG